MKPRVNNTFGRKMKFTLVKAGHKVCYMLIFDILGLQLNRTKRSKNQTEFESISRIHNLVKVQKVSL